MKYKPKRRSIRYPRTVILRSKFKQERNHQWAKRAMVMVLVAGLCLGGWWTYRTVSHFIFCSDCFVIRSIVVRGGKNVTQSEIRALLPFRVGDNLFAVQLGAAENNIRQCKPELKTIHISRRWKSVIVTMTERVPLAVTTIDGQRLGLDEDNIVFPLRGHLDQVPLPEISSAAPDMRIEMIQFIKALSREAQDISPKIQWVSLEANDLVLGLSGGTKILWGPMDPVTFTGKLRRIRQVFADGTTRFHALEYVNVSYYDDGRILVKPRLASPAAKPQAA